MAVEFARRADLVVAVIGATLTTPVFEELKAAYGASPRPPIGVFWDTTVARDERAEELREALRDQTFFGDFGAPSQLGRRVAAFLGQHAARARENRSEPKYLTNEVLTLDPGEEVRKRYYLREGETISAVAEARRPRLKFHFALLNGEGFSRLTQGQPWSDFAVGADAYTFTKSLTAEVAGVHHLVVRRPWWFHVGAARVHLAVLLQR